MSFCRNWKSPPTSLMHSPSLPSEIVLGGNIFRFYFQFREEKFSREKLVVNSPNIIKNLSWFLWVKATCVFYLFIFYVKVRVWFYVWCYGGPDCKAKLGFPWYYFKIGCKWLMINFCVHKATSYNHWLWVNDDCQGQGWSKTNDHLPASPEKAPEIVLQPWISMTLQCDVYVRLSDLYLRVTSWHDLNKIL